MHDTGDMRCRLFLNRDLLLDFFWSTLEQMANGLNVETFYFFIGSVYFALFRLVASAPIVVNFVKSSVIACYPAFLTDNKF